MTTLPEIRAHLTVSNAAAAAEFYKRAFGFEEIFRLTAPSGKLLHCEMRFGNSVLHFVDDFPGMGDGTTKTPSAAGCTTVTLHLYSPDVDAAIARAVTAGAKPTMEVTDMFWGDRFGKVIDPFGHVWTIATRKESFTPEQLQQRADELFAKWKPGG